MSMIVNFTGKVQSVKAEFLGDTDRILMYISMYIYLSRRKDEKGEHENTMQQVLVKMFTQNNSYYHRSIVEGSRIAVCGEIQSIESSFYKNKLQNTMFVSALRTTILDASEIQNEESFNGSNSSEETSTNKNEFDIAPF
ncbi:MAG: hypothetical protein ACRCX2_17540 [Paraclostridium sp.]